MFHFLGIFVWINTVSAAGYSRNRVYQAERKHKTNIGPEISFLNVDKVWREKNITGKNVVVAVLDDGLNYNHTDLRANYERDVSYDFVDNDYYPSASRQSTHGTKCAGIIAAKLHGKCRTGIAYNATLAGLRILSKSTVDKDDMMAKGLKYKKQKVDIYSNSWGPPDNGHNIKGPGLEGQKALKYGAIEGRNRLGSIFVFSSGNGGLFGDSCAFDGYVNSIYTIAVGAVSKTGAVPRYAESCSSIMASTYGDEVQTIDVFNGCNAKVGRTSAAAAFASGIIALLLEANNKLTWRDVQHLIVRTSNPNKAKINKDWIINGAGLMVHPSVGFGVMDAKKLVDVAEHWINVPKQISCFFQLTNRTETIIRKGATLSFPLTNFKACSVIKTLEHVQVEVSLSFYPRAYMLVYLQSPAGTKSQLLYHRVFDAITQRKDYRGLIITSLHFWGENPTAGTGEWTILLKSANFWRPSQVKLHNLKITFYGTNEDPMSKITIPGKGTIPSQQGGKKFWEARRSQLPRCGSSGTYDPTREECCSGTNKIVEKESWCGDRMYNKCEKLCCDGALHSIPSYEEERLCCGKVLYSKAVRVCCGGKLADKSICKLTRRFSEYIGWYQYLYIHEAKCLNGQTLIDVPIYDKPCSLRKQYRYDYQHGSYWDGRKK